MFLEIFFRIKWQLGAFVGKNYRNLIIIHGKDNIKFAGPFIVV